MLLVPTSELQHAHRRSDSGSTLVCVLIVPWLPARLEEVVLPEYQEIADPIAQGSSEEFLGRLDLFGSMIRGYLLVVASRVMHVQSPGSKP